MKALIFGSSGQDGFYLDKLLKLNNFETILVSRSGNSIKGDVSNSVFVYNLVKKHKPNYIFHLAAESSTSHDALNDNFMAICQGSNNILEAVRLESPKTKIFISGSAMQFVNNSKPITEETPFDASSPYSAARIYSVYIARYYRKFFNLQIYIGYLFNHDSPFRTEKHVNQKIIRAVQRIASGSNEKIIIGNIDVKKEFNFAGDIVDAIWKFINQDLIFEILIGSGISYSIKDWLCECFKIINKNWEEYVIINNNYIPEYSILVSDPKLLLSIGWKPRVDFKKLALLMFKN